MKRCNLQDLISAFLILMFTYAAVSKLIDFHSFRNQMLVQEVPKWSISYLIWLIPITEIVAVVCLLYKRTRTYGYFLSVILMISFTIYVGLAITGAFATIPCSCGGVISKLNWPEHFIFNIVFLLLSIYGMILDLKERRFIGK